MTRSPRRPSRGSYPNPDDDDAPEVPSRSRLRNTDLDRENRGGQGLLEKLKSGATINWEETAVEPNKIEFSKRLVATGIDFGVGFLLQLILDLIPLVNKVFSGTLVIVLFLLCRDMLFQGRGIGKNFMGLRVVDIHSGEGPSIKQVLVRNLIYLGPLLLMEIVSRLLQLIPIPTLTAAAGSIFNLLCTLYELVILSVEVYRTYARDDSMRLGDELAGTYVIEADMNFGNDG